MKITPLDISDILIIEPEVFEDKRGFFFESFNIEAFSKSTLLHPIFVQDNHSKSSIGILRGLHYQLPPYSQAKLARVIQGEVTALLSPVAFSLQAMKWLDVAPVEKWNTITPTLDWANALVVA